MDSLGTAVSLIARWKPNQQKGRDEIIKGLNALARLAEQAMRVWQDYLAKPGADGDRFALMSWIGPERAKQLHEINLEAKAAVHRIAELAGPDAGRFSFLDEEPIEMAYRQLKEGETGPEAAQAAVEKLKARSRYFQEIRTRIENTPAARPAAMKRKGTKKKTGGGKAKTARGGKKPAARKKAPQKK